MFSSSERKRYARQIILPEMGLAGQEKLKMARVLVIGAGGLGCPVLQYLAAAGVGHIGIVDDDVVDLTNLHRQILYTAGDVGKSKAATAAEKLALLNPFVEITPLVTRLNAENATGLIAPYDLVVDGSDNFETRYLVNDACVALDKPFVFGSILRFEGHVSVFNYRNGPTYRCLFPDAEGGDNCAEAGVIGILPGIIGTYMASEVIKIVCGIGEPLSGKLLVFNTLLNDISIFKFARSAAFNSGQSALNQPSADPSSDPDAKPAPAPSHPEIPEMSYDDFEALQTADAGQVFLVDVREYIEFEADNFGGENIPLSDIPESIDAFPADKIVVFYCQTGRRSKQAAKLLLESGYQGPAYWAGNW